MIPSTFLKNLNNAISDSEKWNETLYKASNIELYRILGNCHSLNCKLSGDLNLFAAFKKYLVDQDIKTKSNTTTEFKIIKVVFPDAGMSRQSTYAKVLIAAKRNKISHKNLSDWIASEGGIQEIKLAESKSGITTTDKRIEGENLIANREPIYTISDFEHDIDRGSTILLVARINDNNEVEIIDYLNNEKLIKEAMVNVSSKKKSLVDSGVEIEQERVDIKNRLKANRKKKASTTKQQRGRKNHLKGVA